MAIHKINITGFLELAAQCPVIDVRSPGEYGHAHIPGAHNLPLFSDEERKTVGTAYKQQSREEAIKIGLDYFGVKMKGMVEQAEKFDFSGQSSVGKTILLYCWRGGMRSAGLAWLFDLYGFKVYTLVGGYKSYRRWVLAQFEKPCHFQIIGGYTGSGKTLVLQELGKQGKTIIDLEALANHKGSAFGALGEQPQPKQEMFENLLANSLHLTSLKNQETGNNGAEPMAGIWLEDESQRIGNLQIPMPLWHTMRKSPVFFLDIPFEKRLGYLVEEYGSFEKEKMVNAIIRIQKRLGGLETKNAISHMLENNTKECFRILLGYYDKWYGKALFNRENILSQLIEIPCKGVETKTNTQKILTCTVPAIS